MVDILAMAVKMLVVRQFHAWKSRPLKLLKPLDKLFLSCHRALLRYRQHW